MGSNGSTLQGKAVVFDICRQFSVYTEKRLRAIIDHFKDTGLNFALTMDDFASLLKLEFEEAGGLFNNIFDTDQNGLVDAYEVITSLTMLSRLTISEKIALVFHLYDFNGSGEISLDEAVLLMRTALAGTSKIDPRVELIETSAIERIVRLAFEETGLDPLDDITCKDMYKFFRARPEIVAYLEYWDGPLSLVDIPEGETWQDKQFGGGAHALYRSPTDLRSASLPVDRVCWLPLEKLCPDEPILFREGGSGGGGRGGGAVKPYVQGGIVCGSLADHGFLNALAVLTARPAVMRTLFVPTGQEGRGRFCIRFFLDGNWTAVYVDSRVPAPAAAARDGGGGDYLYARCGDSQPNLVWVPLLEKAYAKLHGSYEALVDVDITHALGDLTGGQVSTRHLDTPEMVAVMEQGLLWDQLQTALGLGLLAATFNPRPDTPLRGGIHPEILPRRAYAVLRVFTTARGQGRGEGVRLLQLYCPWGDNEGGGGGGGGERRRWAGEWCNGHPSWDYHPSVADAVGYAPDASDDGSCFWMSFADFTSCFNTLTIVRLLGSDWHLQRRQGRWRAATCGGCTLFPSWSRNPQFYVELPEPMRVAVTLSRDHHALRALRRGTAFAARAPAHSSLGPATRCARDGSDDKWRRAEAAEAARARAPTHAMGLLVCRHDANGSEGGEGGRLYQLRQEDVVWLHRRFRSARKVTVFLQLPAGQFTVVPMQYRPGKRGGFTLTLQALKPFRLSSNAERRWEDVSGLPKIQARSSALALALKRKQKEREQGQGQAGESKGAAAAASAGQEEKAGEAASRDDVRAARDILYVAPAASVSDVLPPETPVEARGLDRWAAARAQEDVSLRALYRMCWEMKVLATELTLKKGMLERKLKDLEAAADERDRRNGVIVFSDDEN